MEKWQTFLIILGGITAIIAFYKKILKPAICWFKMWAKRWNAIFKEFIPDSGKSMKDQVTNMEIKIGVILSTQAAVIRLDNLAIIEYDSHGLCTMVNKSWQTLTGMDLNQAKGWGWLDAIVANGKGSLKQDWLSIIRSNSEFNAQYKYMNRVTHDSFNVEVICIINRNSKEEVISIIGTVIRLQDNTPVKGDKSTP